MKSSKIGVKNPNYKDGRSSKNYFCKCSKKIHLTSALYGGGQCISCCKKIYDSKPDCIDCGKQISYGCKRCKKCDGIHSQKHYYCKCGKELSASCCNKCFECNSKEYRGKGNPNWQGGLMHQEYPWYFTEELKLKIRTRDNFQCQNCDKSEQNHKKKYNRCLDVHHIDYCKDNCSELNLITLCTSCNTRANGDRDYWFAYYTYKMGEK